MEKYKKISYVAIAFLLMGAIAYIFFKYILAILLPFGISLLVVCMLRPLINKLSKMSKASKSFLSIIILFIVTVLLMIGFSFIFSAIIEEIGNIAEAITVGLQNEDNYITRLLDFIKDIDERFPFLNSFLGESDEIYTLIKEIIQDSVKSISIRLTEQIGAIISALPEIILTVIVIFLSLIYFAKDYDRMGEVTLKILPKKISSHMPQIKKDIISVITKYIQSYLLILIITFSELFSGFLILGIDNAFVLSIIISLVDMLPVLGVGGVLMPWAIVLFIGGNTRVGIGLVVMFIIIYLVRQYAEPRIVSKNMNIHPLITLFAMYAGLKLFGFFGMIFAPFIAFVVKTSYESIEKSKKEEITVDKYK